MDEETTLVYNEIIDDSVSEVIIETIEKKGGTLTGALINLFNCAVGAGILSLPFAIDSISLIPGIIIYAVMSIIAMYTLHLLVLCAKNQKCDSYLELVEVLFGKYIRKLFEIIVVLYTFGVLVGYIIIVGDLLPLLLQVWFGYSTFEEENSSDENSSNYSASFSSLEDSSSSEEEIFWLSPFFIQLVVVSLIITPLVFLKKIDSLKIVSSLAVICVLYFTLVVVVTSIIDIQELAVNGEFADKITYFHLSTDMFLGIPLIAFSIGGHIQCISIFSELQEKDQTVKRWDIVSFLLVISLTVVYLTVAVLSYLRFLPGDNSNVLKQMLSYDPNNIWVQITTLAMSVVVIFSYPLISWPLRQSLDSLLFPKKTPSSSTTCGSDWGDDLRFIFENLAIIVSTFVIAVAVDNLEAVFGLTGAIGGVLVKFVLPVAIFLKINYDQNKKSKLNINDSSIDEENINISTKTYQSTDSFAIFKDDNYDHLKFNWYEVVFCWVVLIVGLATGTMSSTTVIIDAIEKF
eukprot:TRINITY_DN10833_c0_g1_i1.p1 TRINITY_DN10833_c0_g1~~TRINITY_DN10833_c0_g1_i1.p1  ORF type:complete len:517 (-),score=112.47 TRINITY_DN10833_c0_g1_i1:12-1562(-)